MKTSLALVHHANQYLITDGYDNREGISAVIGSPKYGSGMAAILDLHEKFRIPINLHISGTLLEAIAWHHPKFLAQLRRLLKTGLIELIGSCYGQNIMRFFSVEYNLKQLNEELWLYGNQLGVDPEEVRVFWPPERVWETKRMAPVLRDGSLKNNGYRYVILDDRLLFGTDDQTLPRDRFDDSSPWSADAYRMHQIRDGLGLRVFPIGTRLRRGIPPSHDRDWARVRQELEAMLVHGEEAQSSGLLAVYADDLEKVAGIGEWGKEGPEKYRSFLEWLRVNDWIEPVLLSNWAARSEAAGPRDIQTGTFQELAKDFDAGEGYDRWYFSADWAPYRTWFHWAEARVAELAAGGADPALLKLAEKQLLVGNWETAWHTPATGPHGDPDVHGHASPWARALTSHSRLAAVAAEAAAWMTHKDSSAHAEMRDVDCDGDEEIVIKNQNLFAVLTPRWGGRLVSLFSIAGPFGAMVIGNPCDDWNWMEELNKYMEVPRNHPGALADVGFENDRYEARITGGSGDKVRVLLRNVENGSAAYGLEKEVSLGADAASISVRYKIPKPLSSVTVESGLSPDYLGLLRQGSERVTSVQRRSVRGYSCHGVSVWIRIQPELGAGWAEPRQQSFGHGRMTACTSEARTWEMSIGVTRVPDAKAPSVVPFGIGRRKAV